MLKRYYVTFLAVLMLCVLNLPAEAKVTFRSYDLTREVETKEQLSGEAGTVTVRLSAFEDWRDDRISQEIFRLGNEDQPSVVMFVNRGVFYVMIAAEDEKPRELRYRSSRGWEVKDVHEFELAWQGNGETTEYFLRVDGDFIGSTTGIALTDLPSERVLTTGKERNAYKGAIVTTELASKCDVPWELQSGSRVVTVDSEKVTGKAYKFWDVGNFTEAYRLVNNDIRDRAQWVFPFVEELNIVYILGGRWEGENEWYLGMNEDGTIRTDFSGLVAQLQGCKAAGYRPRIVLDNCPPQMSAQPNKNAYGNTAPPADEKVWREYVKQAVLAMIEAFGREEVASWYFRVGTEPDLNPAHWSGTKEQYFAHYDYTVSAMEQVLPEAKIGPGNILNPGHGPNAWWARNKWGLEIIDHCGVGVNYATGKVGTRIDHFSCSWYGRVGGSIDNFDFAIGQIRERLDKYPQFKDVTIEVGEHAILHDEYGRRLWAGDTTEWGASFFAALSDRTYHHDVRKVFEWDHATMGVLHPKGHVIVMLKTMEGGERLAVEVDGESAARCGAVAVKKDEKIYVMLYNHRQWRRPRVAESVKLVIRDERMKTGDKWMITERWTDAKNGVFAYEFVDDVAAAGIKPRQGSGFYEGSPWKRYGDEGAELFARNIEKYRELAEMPGVMRLVTVGDGEVVLDYTMPGHSVRLIELEVGDFAKGEFDGKGKIINSGKIEWHEVDLNAGDKGE